MTKWQRFRQLLSWLAFAESCLFLANLFLTTVFHRYWITGLEDAIVEISFWSVGFLFLALEIADYFYARRTWLTRRFGKGCGS